MPVMIRVRDTAVRDRVHDVDPLRAEFARERLGKHAYAGAAGTVGGVARGGAQGAERAGENEGAAFEEGEFVGGVGRVGGEEEGGGELGEVLWVRDVSWGLGGEGVGRGRERETARGWFVGNRGEELLLSRMLLGREWKGRRTRAPVTYVSKL